MCSLCPGALVQCLDRVGDEDGDGGDGNGDGGGDGDGLQNLKGFKSETERVLNKSVSRCLHDDKARMSSTKVC